ncbi:uncharacterized protein KY384_007078 [Bacidia gigantensis]|uniref:uncharacterized protein n=1 Tax=Bacidia gigantensis TaxID=2732470 RepID=UPI001D05BA31|nr:uncharacterized protein KY384_007078 [Bacidia gigantensis]KAG8528161.1 hypothetical protein KY384_007078 [Bacidia gigantensis]
MLRRPFARMQYRNLKGFGEYIEDLIGDLKGCTEAVVDLQPHFFRFTLATTTALIFGQPIKENKSVKHQSFASNFDYASRISAIRIRLADFHWAYTTSTYTRACEKVKDYADSFVKHALDNQSSASEDATSQYAFLKDLFEEYKDPTLVRDQLIHVLIAGRDTTACLLSWAL